MHSRGLMFLLNEFRLINPIYEDIIPHAPISTKVGFPTTALSPLPNTFLLGVSQYQFKGEIMLKNCTIDVRLSLFPSVHHMLWE